MKILFITPISPFEAYSGGGVRTQLLFNAFRQCGEVYTTVINVWGDRGDDLAVSGDVKIVKVPAFRYGPRAIKSVIKHGIRGIFGLSIDQLYPGKEELLKQLGWKGVSFDIVITRFAWLATDIGAWKIAPLYIDVDDLPIDDFNTLQRPKLRFLQGAAHALGVWLWQTIAFKKAVGTWLPDQLKLEQVRKWAKCVYLPNVVRTVPVDYDTGIERKRQLLTVGSLDYSANTEGIDWFLTNVWTDVKAVYPEMTYKIVGKKLNSALCEKWSKVPGVVLAGFVDDIHEVYAESLAVVAPVFKGGGTAVKVIEAFAHGRLVFATPFAGRGLTSSNKEATHLIEFCSSEVFLNGLKSLLGESDEVRKQKESDGVLFVAQKYSEPYFNAQVRKLLINP